MESTDDLAVQGAVVAFDCPTFVEAAEVTIRMLTDLHNAYQTMASAEDGQRYVYTATVDTYAWAFGAAANGSADGGDSMGQSAVLQLSAVAGAVLVAVAAAGTWVRRRQPQPE